MTTETISFSPFPAEITIPASVRNAPWTAHLVERTQRMAQADVVIPLQRSGSLAFELVRGCADALGLALPLVVHLLIGREISYEFEYRKGMQLNDYAWRVGPDTPLPLRLEGEEYSETYYAWLARAARRKTSPVWRAIQRLREATEGLDIREAMIVDESVYQGPTLYMTAPFVVQRALPRAQIRTLELCNARLLHDLLDAHFPELKPYGGQNDAERSLLLTLLKGFVDDSGRLVALDERRVVRQGERLAQWCTYQNSPRPKSPAKTLAARYGWANLLSLHQMTLQALYQLGSSIGEAEKQKA